MDIAAQIIGLVASAFNIGSFQMKDNKRLYICQSIGGVLFSVSFFMLGSYTAALLNLICLLRGGALAAGKKFSGWPMYALVMGLFTLAGVLTYDGYLSIIITAAQLISTTTMFSRNGKVIRVFQFFLVCPAWLYNNIVIFSLGGIITETISMVSILVSFLRFGLDGFVDEREKT